MEKKNVSPARGEARDPGEELVTVELFRDNGRYRDPLFAAVNGETVLIERGVPVRIKQKFLWCIDQSQIQDKQTARMIEQQSAAFARASAELAG